MSKGIYRIFFLVAILCSGSGIVAQSTTQYYHRKPQNVLSGQDALISVSMFISDPIVSGMLFFRPAGEMSYQELPMHYESGNWESIIPGRQVTGQDIEYVVILHKRSWGTISVPQSRDPFKNPLSFTIIPPVTEGGKTVRKVRADTQFIDADILILSPETGSVNRPEEVVIAASLFNAATIDNSNFKVLLDGRDQTKKAIMDEGILTLVPDELPFGLHSVKLLFKTTYGLDVTPVEWAFNVTKGMVDVSEGFRYKGNFGGRTSSNSAAGVNLSEQETNGKIDAELSWVKMRYSYRSSSRESRFLQPLNRESLTIQVTDYLKLEYGDVYPSLSPFILDGKRVRGRHTHVDLPWLQLNIVSGQILRSIDYQQKVNGGYKMLENDTDTDENGNRTFYLSRTGYTFPQDINALRLSFTFFNIFSGGMHFLKAKDDFEEIPQYIDSEEMFTFIPIDSTLDSVYIDNDYINENSQYKFGDFRNLAAVYGDSVTVSEKNWIGDSPRENVVMGFDFETALDNRNLLFQFAWNYSMTNNNIWDGPLTLDELDVKLDTLDNDSLMDIPLGSLPDPEDYKDLFTINQYMVPFVPLDPITFGSNPIRALVNMPSAAFHFRLKGSYSLNNILLEYKQIGPEFHSFGNPYLTNNIREFTIKDRLSLLGRRLMFVVGFNSKDNNLSETVVNPLKTKTLSINTTLVPGPGAPSIVLNLQSIGKANATDTVEVDSLGQFLQDKREDSRALNALFSINIPGSIGPISNTIAINFNSITYTDLVETDPKYADMRRQDDYLFQKTDTRTYSFNLSSRFPFPLRTVLSINKTQLFIPMMDENSIAFKNELSWTSLGLNGSYSFFDNRVRLSSGLDYMANGSGDDAVQLMGGKIGCDWDILNNLTFNAKSNIRFSRVPGNEKDEIDNDKDGKVDNSGEVWSTNSSGLLLSLGYRF